MLNALINALLLVGICLVIHSTGIIILGVAMASRREAIARRGGVFHALLLIAVFSAIMLLHIAENCIWAAFYTRRHVLPNYETSLYFSLSTYTTIGYGDVLLPQRWRLLGALEGISGVLLCGLSTAFLFSAMDVLLRFQMRRVRGEELMK